MGQKYCQRCNVRFMYSNDNTDFIHECRSGIVARDEEDVLRTPSWSDYTGSSAPNNMTVQEIAYQGIANKGWGMRSEIEGEDIEQRTPRGKNTELYRVRRHSEFIDLK